VCSKSSFGQPPTYSTARSFPIWVGSTPTRSSCSGLTVKYRLWWRLFYHFLWCARRGRRRRLYGRIPRWKSRWSRQGEPLQNWDLKGLHSSDTFLGNIRKRYSQTSHHKTSPRGTTASPRRRVQDRRRRDNPGLFRRPNTQHIHPNYKYYIQTGRWYRHH